MHEPSVEGLRQAQDRLRGRVRRTPLLRSDWLDRALGHSLWFKYEGAQHVGAFKVRGALNCIESELESRGGSALGDLVAFSSGNHAQAVAWAAREHGLHARIFMPRFASQLKGAATQGYGAELLWCDTRQEAESGAQAAVERGATLIPPYDHPDVIHGQGTAALEALEDLDAVDAVVAPCGGGGLLSGTSLAIRALSPSTALVGAEPLRGNDAAISRRQGSVHRLEKSPDTIADGARTLYLGRWTFPFVRDADAFFEIDEEEIVAWTQWLGHLLKVQVEPTSAMTVGAALRWLKGQAPGRKVLCVLSGGNLSAQTQAQVWAHDYLAEGISARLAPMRS